MDIKEVRESFKRCLLEYIIGLKNEILRSRLIEISSELLKLNDSIDNIMGYPDNLKLCSCMTLFYEADPNIDVFKKVIDKFYNGNFDENTLNIIKKM